MKRGRFFPFPGLYNKDVTNLIMSALSETDRYMLRCAHFPSMEHEMLVETPLVFAQICDSIKRLKWGLKCGYICNYETCIEVVKHGRLDILRYLYERIQIPWHAQFSVVAASCGHLDVFKYSLTVRNVFVHSYYDDSRIQPNEYWKQCLSDACRNGHVHILNFIYFKYNCTPFENYVFKSTHLNVIDWAYQLGLFALYQARLAVLVASNPILLDWVMENDDTFSISAGLFNDVIRCSGSLRVLKRLRKLNCTVDEAVVCKLAAHNGRLNVLKWLHRKGFKVEAEDVVHLATIFDRQTTVETIEWAKSNHLLVVDNSVRLRLFLHRVFVQNFWIVLIVLTLAIIAIV